VPTTLPPESLTPVVPSEADGLGAGIKAIWNALLRRWLTILLATLVVVLLAVAATMLLEPRYEAVARLRVEPTQNMLVGQTPTGSNLPDQSIVETEASIMASHDLAVEVVRRLNLVNDPELTEGMDDLPPQQSQAEQDRRIDQVADELGKRLDVSRRESTYVVELAVTSRDPVKAAQIANAFVDVYIEQSVSRRTGTAAGQAVMIERRLEELAAKAQEADQRLAQFRAANGIVGEGALSVADQQIAPLAGQLATAQSEAAAARARLAAAQSQIAGGGLTAVSAVLGSPVIANLRAQRAALTTQFEEISTTFGPRHPESIRIQEQLRAVDEQIREEANRVVGSLRSEAAAASARAASLQGDLNALRASRATQTQASGTEATLLRAAEAAQLAYNQAAELAQRTNQIAASPLSQAQLIEAATPPLEPSAPNKRLLLAGGLVLGLLLGVLLAALQELLASGARSRRDLERIGLPLLASVPLQRRRKTGRMPADSMVDAPFTAYAEAFRSMRNTLTISSGKPLQVVALVSSLPGEGKTTTSLSLARMMAMSGERTLIIDADPRGAGLLRLLPAEPEVGLVEVLDDGVAWQTAIQPDVVEGLDILPVSSSEFVQSDVFSKDRLEALLAELRGRYDRIVFDTPPLLGVADARVIASVADAVLMVVRWDKTPRNAIRSTLETLIQDSAVVIGAVFTMVDPRSEAAGGAHYSAYYSSYLQPA